MAGLARVVIRARYAVIASWLVAAGLCIALMPSEGQKNGGTGGSPDPAGPALQESWVR